MKRFATIAMIAALMPVSSMAQNYSFDDDVNAELDKMYLGSSSSANNAASQTQSGPQVHVNVATTQTAPVAQQVAPVAQPVSQPVVTAPVAAPIAAPVVQKQDTTIVEAAPLKESSAELIRKSRQDAEVATEQKIVERLERSRLDDEQRRSEVLFGDKFNAIQNQNKQVGKEETTVVVTPNNSVAPVVVGDQAVVSTSVVTAPAVVEEPPVKQDVIDRETIRSEVRASLAEMKENEAPKKASNKTYVSGLAGLGEYPDVKNVRGNYALGFAFGQKIDDRLLIEGSFLYSSYDVEQRDGFCYYFNGCYPRITGMEQYQGAAVGKYQLLGGVFRPVIGGTLAYTYRTFSDKQFGSSTNNAQSHAVDIGVVTGADLEFSPTFTVGLDVRYMWNLTSRTQSSGFQRSFSESVYGSDTPIEKLSHMSISLFGRATF